MRQSRARIAHAVTALLAWAGVAMTVVISALGAYKRGFWEPHLYGIHPDGAAGVLSRLGDTLSYFTMWSNIVVALSATLLALAPRTVTPARRALRLSGLLMITITAIVYALILAPDDVVVGWSRITNPLQHLVVPGVTLLVWLVWGPRGWFTMRTVAASLVIPLAWVAWMLGRGAVIDAYPYGFVNVATLGYPRVALTLLVILGFALLVAAAFRLVDRLLRRP